MVWVFVPVQKNAQFSGIEVVRFGTLKVKKFNMSTHMNPYETHGDQSPLEYDSYISNNFTNN